MDILVKGAREKSRAETYHQEKKAARQITRERESEVFHYIPSILPEFKMGLECDRFKQYGNNRQPAPSCGIRRRR